MSRPVLRVLTAAWPSRTEPRRARFLENLHREISTRYETEVIAPLVHEGDPVTEQRHGMAIERFSYPSRGKTVKSGGIGPIAAFTYLIASMLTARDRYTDPSRERVRGGAVLVHWVVPLGWVAARLAARLQLPLVLYAHGSDVNVYARTRVGRLFLRRAVRRADLIFVASEALAEAIERAVLEPPPVVVLPVGVERDFRRGESPPAFDGALRVLFVGDPIESKGITRIAEAVERCRARGLAVELEWIGGTPEAIPAALGRVRGDLEAEEVADAMRGAHLLLLPSQSEGTPLVIQEAIVSGLPWAATPVGGIPALHRAFPGGTLLPEPGEPERVVEAIVDLLAQWHEAGEAGVHARWRAMGETAQAARTALGVEARAQLFVDHLDRVMRRAS